MSNEDGQSEPIIIQPGALEAMTRAEVDIKIATAKRYPRSLDLAQKRLTQMACFNERTAGECLYALPRGGKPIEGASARFAEILANTWGNVQSGARIVHVGDTTVTAQGVCHDLETNNSVTVEVSRRITDKNGRRYNEDMIGVTSNAACAIAHRNAVLKCIPKALWITAYEQAKKTAAGDAKSFEVARQAVIDQLTKKHGIKIDRILIGLGVKGIADITAETFVIMRGALTAIESGELSAADAFSFNGEDGDSTATDSRKSQTEKAKEALSK